MSKLFSKKVMTGFLELISGPMYSNKTGELIRICGKYKAIGKKILVINHQTDVRYSNNQITTHNGLGINAIMTNKLNDLDWHSDRFDSVDMVIIDEAQFFTDLVDWVMKGVNLGIHLVVAGLMADYNQELFGNMHQLIPKADHILFLKAFCSICRDGTPAPFTKRIKGGDHQVEVGSNGQYIAVCRKHRGERSSP